LDGSSPADWIGKTEPDRFEREIAEALIAKKRSVLLTGESANYEFSIPVGPDKMVVRLIYEARKDSLGEIIGLIGSVMDISDLVEATSLARASEHRLSQKLDAMPNIAWASDPAGDVDFVNRSFREYTGPLTHTGDAAWQEIVHPQDYPAAKQAYDRSLQTGWPSEWTLRIRRRDGEYRWHISRLVPIRDEQGSVVRWFGTSTDIHEHKLAIEAVSAERERVRLALETAHAGAWEWDIERNRMTWSSEMYDLHGVPHDAEKPIRVAAELTNPDDLKLVRERFVQAVDEEGIYDVDARIEHPTRGPRWLHSRGSPLRDRSGKMTKFIGVTVDVTDRKVLEVELENKIRERTTELERANRELEGFTYSVSHDLRAPLRAINATSATLKIDFGDILPPEVQEILKRQAQAASKMGQLIDDLLKLSRLGREE